MRVEIFNSRQSPLAIVRRAGGGVGSHIAEPGVEHISDVNFTSRILALSTSEVYIRNMFDAWLGYMTADPPASTTNNGKRALS